MREPERTHSEQKKPLVRPNEDQACEWLTQRFHALRNSMVHRSIIRDNLFFCDSQENDRRLQ